MRKNYLAVAMAALDGVANEAALKNGAFREFIEASSELLDDFEETRLIAESPGHWDAKLRKKPKRYGELMSLHFCFLANAPAAPWKGAS